MKKAISLLMMFVLVFALSGCDKLPGSTGGSASSAGSTGGSTGGNLIEADEEDGYAEGYIGDTIRTYFFDFVVNDAQIVAEYEGYTPAEGNELLVVDLTVTNTDTESIPMFDTDFQAQWGDDENEDAFAVPVTEVVSDKQLPETYELGIKETREGILLFEVPTGNKDFSVSYMEFFDNDETGSTFFVLFTPERAA